MMLESGGAYIASDVRSREMTTDEQAWLRARVLTAIRMAVGMFREKRVGADDSLFEGGLGGLARGTTEEIAACLGMRTPQCHRGQ